MLLVAMDFDENADPNELRATKLKRKRENPLFKIPKIS